jgi:type VI secretion system secreted protein Hcp
MVDVRACLRLSGIPGEAQDPRHMNEIEVRSWGWGLSTATGAGTGSGHSGSAKPRFQELSLVKWVDKSSPKLAEACATAKHLQEAVLSVCRTGGAKFVFDFLVVKLSDVKVSRFEEVTNEADPIPAESISLDYSKIDYSYLAQKSDGSLDAPVTWSWDLKRNRAP